MEDTGKKRRKIIFLCIFLLFLSGAAGGWHYWKQRNAEAPREAPGFALPQDGSGFIMASGATMVGMEKETFELKTEDAMLEVEEVYLSQGDEVEEGGEILKFTEESLEEVRLELEHAAAEAGLYYRQAAAAYEEALIEAQEAYDKTLLDAEYAKTVQEDALAQAQEEVDALKEELQAAQELYEEYYAGIYEGGYEEEYEIADKKALYETNEALYWNTLRKWNIDDSEINHSGGSGGAGESPSEGGGGMPGGGGSSRDPWQITALEELEDTYRANKEAYEQALEDCGKAADAAQAGIEQAKAEYELLKLKVEQAEIDYNKKAAACGADYKTALAKGQTARDTYQTEVKRQKEALTVLEDEKEEAEENLAWFREYASDGYLYTQSRGTVVAVAASEGTELEEGAVLLAYSNPDIVTVTAAVGQSDIASVQIGQKAAAVTEEYGNFAGTVTEINPVSSSGGRSGVTYSVEITLEGEVSRVEANRTVTVYFGIGPEELPMTGGDTR